MPKINIQALIDKFEQGTISKHDLGKLRRSKLDSILSEFERNPADAIAVLNNKRTKIDLNKLSEQVGFGIKAVNIRQTFKDNIKAAEKSLGAANIINAEKDANEQHQEVTKNFIAFLESRLSEPKYQWPINQKGSLYRKAVWAFFIDTPLEDIGYTSPLLSKDKKIASMLSDIDLRIATGELEIISFASDSALDEMSDSMRSRAISKLRQQLKDAENKVTAEREARLKAEKELALFKQAKKKLLGSKVDAVKAGSIH